MRSLPTAARECIADRNRTTTASSPKSAPAGNTAAHNTSGRNPTRNGCTSTNNRLDAGRTVHRPRPWPHRPCSPPARRRPPVPSLSYACSCLKSPANDRVFADLAVYGAAGGQPTGDPCDAGTVVQTQAGTVWLVESGPPTHGRSARFSPSYPSEQLKRGRFGFGTLNGAGGFNGTAGPCPVTAIVRIGLVRFKLGPPGRFREVPNRRSPA